MSQVLKVWRMDMASESRELEKVGALWRRKSKKGTEYLSGVVGEQRVIIFKVREKRSAKSPDYQVFKSDPPATEGGERTPEE
jgi:hypothetical protein